MLALVVDDIRESREELCALVIRLGHEAIGCDGGESALSIVQERRPDIVLLDLLMPDVDGFEVTRRIRAIDQNRWLPVIVTSSLRGEEHFIHALENGADDFLTRPVNAALLAAKLRHYGRVLNLQGRLAAMTERQRNIHDNILEAVITIDDAGTIVDANLAACRMFGSGQTSSLSGLRSQTVLGADLAALREGGELTLLRPDGSVLPVAISQSEWDESGHLHRTLVVRDLTQQHRVERMKDEFLATVSHELRTPLTSVLGALGLLAAGAAGPLPPDAAPLAQAAQRNGHRLSRLIDDILDLTKLEGDRLEMHPVLVAIGPLLLEAQSANQGYADRVGVSLCLEVASDATSAEVRLDPNRFLQVMANLLSNAIKHSPPNETVIASVEKTGRSLTVRVRDQGPGIDPSMRSRMFEKFSQADGSDHRVQGGTGLGLYISRMLVERMGGQIRVEPASSAGTVFAVEFPLAVVRTPPAQPWILIVDNDLDALAHMAHWIEPLCVVDTVANLAQAENRVRGYAPPIVIADTRAQGEAHAFCAGLRRLAMGRGVFLYTDAVDEDFARSVGATWIRKSGATQDELLRALEIAISQARRSGGQ